MDEPEIDLLQKWRAKQDALLQKINEALDSLELEMELDFLHLVAKRGRACPPGYVAAFEPVVHPDGSVTYEWICKKS